MKFKYHEDGTLPKNGEVFVFGSNLAGRHGAGAALAAKNLFGAKYGVGIGWSGNSIAIPTKDKNLTTLSLFEIEVSVLGFIKTTELTLDKSFFVTRIGCGLAGYKDEQIAPMFKGCNPHNISFPKEWYNYLEG